VVDRDELIAPTRLFTASTQGFRRLSPWSEFASHVDVCAAQILSNTLAYGRYGLNSQLLESDSAATTVSRGPAEYHWIHAQRGGAAESFMARYPAQRGVSCAVCRPCRKPSAIDFEYSHGREREIEYSTTQADPCLAR
jgi:hypothetical protein